MREFEVLRFNDEKIRIDADMVQFVDGHLIFSRQPESGDLKKFVRAFAPRVWAQCYEVVTQCDEKSKTTD